MDIDKALTTLDRVKVELDISDNASDAKLTNYILETSAAIESYCGRSFHKETLTENVEGKDTPFILVSKAPIISIASITIEGVVMDSSTYRIHDAKAGIIAGDFVSTARRYSQLTQTPVAGSEYALYEVEYTAGYDMPSSVDRNLPYDLESACIAMIRSKFFANSCDPSIKKESATGAGSVEYADSAMTSSPSHYAELLSRFRLGTGLA